MTPLDAALKYAHAGMPVIPLHSPLGPKCDCRRPKCTSPAKHPRTLHGLKDATTDPAKIGEWWEMWPNANVGLLTGAGSGIVVLDIDPRHDGEDSLAELQVANNDLPDTLVARTGSGGRHIVFRHPGLTVRNRAAIAPGVDVRGDGGYIVAPPSIHVCGGIYQWAGKTPIAPLPDWLAAKIRQPSNRATTDIETWERLAREPIKSGQRHDALARLTGKLLRGNIPDSLAGQLVWLVNSHWCDPPLDRKECERIIHDIIERDHERKTRPGH